MKSILLGAALASCLALTVPAPAADWPMLGRDRSRNAVSPEKLYAIRPDGKGDRAPGLWPQWRGPDRANVSPETGLLKQWPKEGPPLAWKATGLGEGVAPVSVKVPAKPGTIRSVSGQKGLEGMYEGGEVRFKTDLAEADYILLLK